MVGKPSQILKEAYPSGKRGGLDAEGGVCGHSACSRLSMNPLSMNVGPLDNLDARISSKERSYANNVEHEAHKRLL